MTIDFKVTFLNPTAYSGHWLRGHSSTVRSAKAFCTILHLNNTANSFYFQWHTNGIQKKPNATRSDNKSKEKKLTDAIMPLCAEKSCPSTLSLIVIPASSVPGHFDFKASLWSFCTKATPRSQKLWMTKNFKFFWRCKVGFLCYKEALFI